MGLGAIMGLVSFCVCGSALRHFSRRRPQVGLGEQCGTDRTPFGGPRRVAGGAQGRGIEVVGQAAARAEREVRKCCRKKRRWVVWGGGVGIGGGGRSCGFLEVMGYELQRVLGFGM